MEKRVEYLLVGWSASEAASARSGHPAPRGSNLCKRSLPAKRSRSRGWSRSSCNLQPLTPMPACGRGGHIASTCAYSKMELVPLYLTVDKSLVLGTGCFRRVGYDVIGRKTGGGISGCSKWCTPRRGFGETRENHAVKTQTRA